MFKTILSIILVCMLSLLGGFIALTTENGDDHNDQDNDRDRDFDNDPDCSFDCGCECTACITAGECDGSECGNECDCECCDADDGFPCECGCTVCITTGECDGSECGNECDCECCDADDGFPCGCQCAVCITTGECNGSECGNECDCGCDHGCDCDLECECEHGCDCSFECECDNCPGTTIIESGDLSIHFLELGNRFTGDCVYINYGEIDILIDAGSRNASSATITNYISNYIQDNKIEYVIATHAHQDHIAGFYSTNTTTGVLDSFEIGMIIDYPRSDSTSKTRDDYEATRDRLVAENGTEHYTALQCYNNEGGAQRVYELGPGVTMEILYQRYYVDRASTENNYSVCIMIVQDGKQYLFTGDLEKAGEDSLVDHYEENHGGLGHCVLYKGGHHGSSTSSNIKLMEAITPEYIIICTCAGSTEYSPTIPNQFPTQEFIDRIAVYTDKVYVTTMMIDVSRNTFGPLNGNVIFSVKEGEITIICSGDDRILKETEWFKEFRTTPAAWT